jgi:hypothetical protein
MLQRVMFLFLSSLRSNGKRLYHKKAMEELPSMAFRQ